MKADKGGSWWRPRCLLQRLGWDLGTSEPYCWIAEHMSGICCCLRGWWRGPLGYWSLGCGFSLHFLSLQEFMVSLMRSLVRLAPSSGCLGQPQLQRVFKQHRVCIMAGWHISLWGFSLLLVPPGAPGMVSQRCHGAHVPAHGLLWCCPVSRAGEQVIARTRIIQPRAPINTCLQFLANIPGAGYTSLKLPVRVAFVVT